MRLTIVTPSVSRQGGGVSEAVRLLVRLLAGRPEITMQVLALRDGDAGTEAMDWGEAKVRTFRTFGPANYAFSPGLLWAVLRARTDLIHVHGIWKFHCLAVHIARRMTSVPYVVTPHGMMEAWIRARSPRLKALVSRLYQDRFLRRAAAFHILTEKERSDVEAMTPGAPTELIPNYVEPVPDALPRPGWWTPDLAGRRIILFFGRIHSKKGPEELCDAWEALCTATPDLSRRAALVFCGPVDDLPGFEARLAHLAERFGNVVFAGPQYGDDKMRSIAAAAFLCLPSKSEGLPLSVLEGWAAGVPAIITAECNLEIGLARGAAIATGTNAGSILSSLREALAMPADRHEAMRSAARGLADEMFSADAVRGSLLALYRRCAGQPRAGRRE